VSPELADPVGAVRVREATDRAVLQVVLKVRDGADPSYSWVTCGVCETAWQVPFFAEESVG
jgi:hypothetical protein